MNEMCIRDRSYAVVKAPNGEMYIMAEALVEKVMKVGGVEGYEVVETHPGAFFENMLADHPFLPCLLYTSMAAMGSMVHLFFSQTHSKPCGFLRIEPV